MVQSLTLAVGSRDTNPFPLSTPLSSSFIKCNLLNRSMKRIKEANLTGGISSTYYMLTRVLPLCLETFVLRWGPHRVVQAVLKLTILLPHAPSPSAGVSHRHVPPRLAPDPAFWFLLL